MSIYIIFFSFLNKKKKNKKQKTLTKYKGKSWFLAKFKVHPFIWLHTSICERLCSWYIGCEKGKKKLSKYFILIFFFFEKNPSWGRDLLLLYHNKIMILNIIDVWRNRLHPNKKIIINSPTAKPIGYTSTFPSYMTNRDIIKNWRQRLNILKSMIKNRGLHTAIFDRFCKVVIFNSVLLALISFQNWL